MSRYALLWAVLLTWAAGIIVGVLMERHLHACTERPVRAEDFRR